MNFQPSVSVLLPVFNAQNRLERSVAQILDVLPELAERFELLIIDDGSWDDTIDVAKQLAREYPQVAAIRHPVRLGLIEAVQTGLDLTEGDVVFVGDEQHGLNPEDLRRLWPLRHEREQLLRPEEAAQPVKKPNWLARLLGRKSTGPTLLAGVQMLRRHELDALSQETQVVDLRHRVDRKHQDVPSNAGRSPALRKSHNSHPKRGR